MLSTVFMNSGIEQSVREKCQLLKDTMAELKLKNEALEEASESSGEGKCVKHVNCVVFSMNFISFKLEVILNYERLSTVYYHYSVLQANIIG